MLRPSTRAPGSQASPARGVYRAKLGGSEGVAGCLVWHPDLQRRSLAGSEGAEAEWAGGSPPSCSTPVRGRCMVGEMHGVVCAGCAVCEQGPRPKENALRTCSSDINAECSCCP